MRKSSGGKKFHDSISDHFNGEIFFNPQGKISKTFRDFLKWKMQGGKKKWPKWLDTMGQPAIQNVTSANQLALTFINHVTYLIQTNDLNFLTDPVYSLRASPLQWLGPKRVRAPGLAFEQLPQIHAVLVSHNHYDHMDLNTLRRLKRQFDPIFVTPLGNGATLKSVGIEKIVENDWWEEHVMINGTKITTVPAQHWSGRMVIDRNRSLWSGFVIESGRSKILFAGDTGYGPHFKSIHQRFGSMDVALLPIGAYEPRWFMREQHMDPDDAVLAHQDLQAKISIGMHFGTFQLTDEAIDDPVKELKVALQKYQVDSFVVLEEGQTKFFNF